MADPVKAYTKLDGAYPGFVNLTQKGDNYILTVRGDPRTYNGNSVCGRDCVPGSAVCNNYCNKAPQKGLMAKHPPPANHLVCGDTISLTLTAAQLAAVKAIFA